MKIALLKEIFCNQGDTHSVECRVTNEPHLSRNWAYLPWRSVNVPVAFHIRRFIFCIDCGVRVYCCYIILLILAGCRCCGQSCLKVIFWSKPETDFLSIPLSNTVITLKAVATTFPKNKKIKVEWKNFMLKSLSRQQVRRDLMRHVSGQLMVE